MQDIAQELIEKSKEYFESSIAFNNYDGKDRYSSISTNWTPEYISISNRFFKARDVLSEYISKHNDELGSLQKKELKLKIADTKLWWVAKTWNDIHLLAHGNPQRMFNDADMHYGKDNWDSICSDIMKLLDKAEKQFENYIFEITSWKQEKS